MGKGRRSLAQTSLKGRLRVPQPSLGPHRLLDIVAGPCRFSSGLVSVSSALEEKDETASLSPPLVRGPSVEQLCWGRRWGLVVF